MTAGPTSAVDDPRTDAQAVYAALRGQILSGDLPPGAPLREVALAERFGVSRTPVREALRRLQQDRLLARDGRGMQVRAIDPNEVVQVYDMRVLLVKQMEGYSYEEIGRIMNLSESQVKVYLHRARLQLKDYLVKVENVI